jgi:predicted secreted Zn-dependent protease
MEATKKPAMQASLKDLKEILDEALAQVKKCREKHIVSRLIKADSLSKDLQKVNQDIMDQMQIAHFAIAVNNSKQTALIVSRITSGVQLTLAKVLMLLPILC